jgi:hypothetical protein
MSITPTFGDAPHLITGWMVQPGGAAIACSCEQGFLGTSLQAATNLHAIHVQSGNQHIIRREREDGKP